VLVVAVAASIAAVFAVPLIHHLATPAKPSTATSLPTTVPKRPQIGSQSDVLSAVSCTSASACTAVGSYDNVTLAETWNGARWSLEPTPNPSGSKRSALSGVSCTSATSCTAVGSYDNVTLAEAWNGAKWSLEPTPNPTGSKSSSLSGVSCTSASVCTAVGSYDNSAGDTATLAEAWNGTTWAIQPTPNPHPANGTHVQFLGLSGVSCTSATVCVAVGGYSYLGNYATLAEAWHGTTWAIQPTPEVSGATLAAVSCTSATACVAVGGTSPDGTTYTRVEAWNGTRWAVDYGTVGSVEPHLQGNGFLGLSCVAANACTIVGHTALNMSALAEVWNGKTLTFESTATSSTSFFGVSCTSATACVAVGSAENSSGTEVTLAEGWNGTKWTVEPTARALPS